MILFFRHKLFFKESAAADNLTSSRSRKKQVCIACGIQIDCEWAVWGLDSSYHIP